MIHFVSGSLMANKSNKGRGTKTPTGDNSTAPPALNDADADAILNEPLNLDIGRNTSSDTRTDESNKSAATAASFVPTENTEAMDMTPARVDSNTQTEYMPRRPQSQPPSLDDVLDDVDEVAVTLFSSPFHTQYNLFRDAFRRTVQHCRNWRRHNKRT